MSFIHHKLHPPWASSITSFIHHELHPPSEDVLPSPWCHSTNESSQHWANLNVLPTSTILNSKFNSRLRLSYLLTSIEQHRIVIQHHVIAWLLSSVYYGLWYMVLELDIEVTIMIAMQYNLYKHILYCLLLLLFGDRDYICDSSLPRGNLIVISLCSWLHALYVLSSCFAFTSVHSEHRAPCPHMTALCARYLPVKLSRLLEGAVKLQRGYETVILKPSLA